MGNTAKIRHRRKRRLERARHAASVFLAVFRQVGDKISSVTRKDPSRG
jgi:hypothetical protein